MRASPCALLVVLLAGGCRSVLPVMSPVKGPVMSPEALERHIAYLASDELEGRDSGTPGGRKAEEYVLRELGSAGLDAVETQPFEFIAGASKGPGNRLQIGGRTLPEGSFQPAPFSAPGGGEWPAVFAGFGIAAADLGFDEYRGLEVKGKVVVALSGSPEGDHPHGKFSAHQSHRAKALKAHALGAAALILLVPRLPAFEGEEISRDVGLPVLLALESKAGGPLGLDPEAERTARRTAAGEGHPAGGSPGSSGAGRPLERSIRLQADVRLEKRAARNVLGWLRARGSGATGELIIVGAHHDGLGLGGDSSMRRERRGEIHNGADDNASGVAGLIELARSLAPEADELRRSVLFMTFAGEERGLLGSKRFAEGPLLRDLRPVAMVNLDMVGRLKDRKLMVSGLATSEDWPEVLAAAKARRESAGGAPLAVLADRTEDIFGSSDHLSFYGMGLPVLFFFTGAHQDYHTPDDDLYRSGPDGGRELKLNLEGLREVMTMVKEVVLELSKLPVPPAHKPGVDLSPRMKFKAALRLMPDYGADVEGMRIAEVNSEGPAARAGLKSGDVVVRFGATPVRSVRDYMVGLEQAEPGREIEVEYIRKGERQVTRVVPSSPGR